MAVSPTLDGGLTPAPPGFEGNAPGLPQVDLPQVAAAPAPEPEPLANVTAPPVIEVGVPPDQATPGTATPDAATAPPVAPAPAAAPAAAPAPEPAQAAPVGAPGDSFGPPEGETQVAGGLMELIQRLSRVTPDSMPRPRAQDFLDVTPRGQIAVREATQVEAAELARIVGQNAVRPFKLISMRGEYLPEDTQRFIDAVRQANQSLFDDARRGIQTRADAIAAAERIGLDGAARMLLERKAGEAFNSEQIVATIMAVQNAFNETQAAAQAMQAMARGPDQAAATRRFASNLAFTASLVVQANGVTAEAGRALGVLGQLTAIMRQSPADMDNLVRRFGNDVLSSSADPYAALVDLLGGEAVLRTQAAAWVALPDAASRARFAQASLTRRVGDAIVEAYVNSLLAMPSTHVVNIFGNATYGLWSVPERFLAGMIGTARTAMHLGSQEQVYMSEALAQLGGLYHGFGDALRLAGETWRTGIPADASSKLDLPRFNAISAESFNMSGPMGQAVDVLGSTFRLPGRALITEDAFFKHSGQRMELWAQARRHQITLMQAGVPYDDAAREAARMMEHPPEMWRDAADRAARTMTFQQEMGPYLQQLANVMQHPLAKVYIAAFFTTPVNVYRAVLQRSPGAVISPQVWADISAGGARADMAMSRIALGSAVMWYFSGQVMDAASSPDFRITGRRPENPAMGQAWDRQGLQEYSMCGREAGRWNCTSYARVDPLSGLLGMAADMAHHVMENPQESTQDQIVELMIGAAQGIYDYTLTQPMSQGISDMARMLSERPTGPGEGTMERAAGLFAERTAAAVLMPATGGTMMGGIERAIDPTMSNVRPETPETANANPITRGFDQAWQRMRSRIPGNEVAPRLNIWGEVVQPTEGGALPLFWPFRMTSGRADALEDRLMALGGVLTLPGDKFPNTNVRLTASQYNWIIQRMNDDGSGGQTFREQLVDLVQDSSFTNMDPKQQADTIRLIRRTRWEAATRDALDNFPDLDRRVTRDREFRAVTGRSPPPEQEP